MPKARNDDASFSGFPSNELWAILNDAQLAVGQVKAGRYKIPQNLSA
jgi:hypothetical protein